MSIVGAATNITPSIVLERRDQQPGAVPEFVIHIDEPVWNVIVYICLNLVALPVMEYLSDILVRKTATMKLLKDERVLLSDSRLGILSLYSTYYGRYRSLVLMILLGFMVIVMETFAEFCSSSAELSEKMQIDVWKIREIHNFSYIHGGIQAVESPAGGGMGFNLRGENANVSVREDRLESVLNSKDCIWAENLVLRLNDSGSTSDFEPIIRAHYLNGKLSSSRLFLSSDNSSIVCDFFKSKPLGVEVWMPAVGEKNGTYVTTAAQNIALRTNSRPPINWSKRIRFGESVHTVYGFRNGKRGVNKTFEDSYTCLQMYEDEDCGDSCESVACAFHAMRNFNLIFGFGEGSIVSTEEEQIADIRRWRMESRSAVSKKPAPSSSRTGTLSERTVRFVVRMYHEGFLWATLSEEIEKKRVVAMSRYVRSMRSESLVNGELQELQSTFIQPRAEMVRQVPTITALAAIPLSLFVLIVVVQLVLLRRLERKIRMRKTIRGVAKGAAKVETSMQWFRHDFVKLLACKGLNMELGDISLRLENVGGKRRLQILPDISQLHKQL